MKILVVDDEALLVKGIRFNLQQDGYEVITGCDGVEAVELAKRYGVNEIDARRAALLHDITKALDGPLQLTLCDGYGKILSDFSITCTDGNVFRLSEQKGKVVVINLWATYCGPCVHELPYFNDLYKEHGDDIAMLAAHSSIVTDDPAEFLKDKGWEIPFTVDTDDDLLWKIVNGSSTLPQTIVLDKDGIVVYNQKGSVTPEMLEALYKQAEQGYY